MAYLSFSLIQGHLQQFETGNYFPSTVGNLWTYNVESVNQEDSDLDYTTTDFMTLNTETGNSFTLKS